MTTRIYYFTGTGNSLAVAKEIVANLDAELISMASVMDQQRVVIDVDALGLIFPVYHKGLPLIVKRFAEKLENLSATYIFAVGTYGDTIGMGMRHLAQIVESRGGQLAVGFGVHLPYNYLTPQPVLKDFHASFTLREIPPEKQQALFADAPNAVERIVGAVRARSAGDLEITADFLTRLADRLGLNETLGKSSWLKVAGVTEKTDLSFIESRQLMDRAFGVDESCTGCGTCARICPVGNIRMVDGDASHQIPEWQQRCEQCFACLHWCPQTAVQFGTATVGKRRYHHPNIKLSDMLRQAAG